MLFQKGQLLVRYVIKNDASIISKWLTDPEVLQYYEGRDNLQSIENVLEHFIHNPNSNEKRCLVEFNEISIGYIQMYPVDSEWKALYGYEESQNIWAWTNSSVNQCIGEKELEQNLFKQLLHTLWRNWVRKQSRWILE
ncbi:conserved hypothetical protein [Bacillus mycoides]|uniref:GNAT family N-acetyltransferase n=1 Tax=Bacillus mycoides TaxID=1405 RepID=A0A654BHU1_BACMY|nr:hypothetical protein IG7_02780 [Bacillus cereus HuA2-4]VXC80100.1 conserved hypothetical protein [Bacillus mycoides]